MICHRSERAWPGALTSCCQNWVRRSALPNAPSFSTHIARGRIRSAPAVVTVGYTSDTTMKLSGLRNPGQVSCAEFAPACRLLVVCVQ